MNTALAQLIETELEHPEIKLVSVTDDSLIVDLRDGHAINMQPAATIDPQPPPTQRRTNIFAVFIIQCLRDLV